MNTRIRYEKSELGKILKSVRNFQTIDNLSVSVTLDLNNMSFIVKNVDTNEVVFNGGDTRNETILKRQAKSALASLGVNFEPENRAEKVRKKVEPDFTTNPVGPNHV